MSVIVFFSVHIVVKPTIWKHIATSEKKIKRFILHICDFISCNVDSTS